MTEICPIPLPRNSVLSTSRAGFYNPTLKEYATSVALDDKVLNTRNHSQFEYPQEGWYWFDSLTAALKELELEVFDFLEHLDSSGFYNANSKIRAGLFVYGPGYILLKDHYLDHTYPVDGWYWFDSAKQASETLQIPIRDFTLDLY